MNKTLKIIIAVIAAILIVGVVYAYTHKSKNDEKLITSSIDTWEVYTNNSYGYELKYPSNWRVVNENSGSVILSDEKGSSITILPNGEPKDGRYELSLLSDVSFSAPIKSKRDILTFRGEPYAIDIYIDHDGKNGWNGSGMIKAQINAENAVLHCFRNKKEIPKESCDVLEGDYVAYDVKSNPTEFKWIKEILSTFKFINNNSVIAPSLSTKPNGDSQSAPVITSITSAITVVSPNSNVSFKRGQKVPIKWTTTGMNTSDKVYIAITDYNSAHLDTQTINDGKTSALQGQYDWVIPANYTLGSKYKISIYTENQKQTDSSDNYFSITN